jgi:hypothetical protein
MNTGRIHPNEWSSWLNDPRVVAAEDLSGQTIAALYIKAIRTRPLDLDTIRYAIAYAQRVMDTAVNEAADPYSLSAVMATPHGEEYARFAATVRDVARLSPGQVVNQALEYWHRATWVKAGRQVYDVSPGLAERLAKTHLRGLTTDDLHLPYKSLYITVPKRAGLRVYNEETQWHTLTGIYITEGETPVGSGMPRETDVPKGWRVMLWGAPKTEESRFAGSPLADADDALFHFTVPLPTGATIEDVIDHVLGTAKSLMPGETEEVRAFFYEHFQPIFRWMMNVVLYATWPGGEQAPFIPDAEARALWEKHERSPKGTPKRRDALDRFRALPPYRQQQVTILGRRVRVMDEDASGQGIPLAVRTLVEGHWRHQHYGPGNAQVKRIWIQPFWRGPDDAPISVPIHRMVPPTAGEEG